MNTDFKSESYYVLVLQYFSLTLKDDTLMFSKKRKSK